MQFRLIIYESAEEDLNDAFKWAARHAPQTAKRWLSRCKAEIAALQIRAAGCPKADEARKTVGDLRQLQMGTRPNVYRVLFFIKNDEVHVIRVMRAQRRRLTRKQIDDALRRRKSGGSDDVS